MNEDGHDSSSVREVGMSHLVGGLLRTRELNPIKNSLGYLMGSYGEGFEIWVDLGVLDQGSDTQDVTNFKEDESIDLKVELSTLNQKGGSNAPLNFRDSQGSPLRMNNMDKNFVGDNHRKQKRVRFSDHIIVHSIPAEEADEEGNGEDLHTGERISSHCFLDPDYPVNNHENVLIDKELQISRENLLISPKDILQAMALPMDYRNESCNDKEKRESPEVTQLENSIKPRSSRLCSTHISLANSPMLDFTSNPSKGRLEMIYRDRDCLPTVSRVLDSIDQLDQDTSTVLNELHKSDVEKDNLELENMKHFLQDLTYNVDRFYALNPLLCKVHRPRLGSAWNIEFSEDRGKLTFRKGVRARKRRRATTREEVSRVPGSFEGKIQSDDLEEDDTIHGRPEWMRQYRSINALVS